MAIEGLRVNFSRISIMGGSGEAGRTGQTRRWGRRFDQRREHLSRKAIMVVMVAIRITRQHGKRQGEKGLRDKLALETPMAATCAREALLTSELSVGHAPGRLLHSVVPLKHARRLLLH